MTNWLAQQALSIALPLIIGPLAFAITQWLKSQIWSLEKASAPTKQAVALVLSFLLAGLVKVFGDALPGVCILADDPITCLNALTNPSAMSVLLSAVIAHVIHSGKKQRDASTDLWKPKP